MITVQEIPTKKNEDRPFATGVYHLNGPSKAMVESFWDSLVEQGDIKDYVINEEA